MIARIKKNDLVIVIAGKDKGKQGAVLDIFPKRGKVLVKDVALATMHLKARRAGETAGIKKRELPIDVSNVMPFCVSCKKPCRISYVSSEDGSSSRACSRCKKIF